MDTKNVIKTSMQRSIKYICAILLLVGMSGSLWGTTTTQVIFPAGTTSSYSAGDWGQHGAYIGTYPTSEVTESMCISDGVGFDVKFYYAYDAGTTNGLQLKKNSNAYVEMTITSSNGITVEVTYSSTSDFDIELTGASKVTASSDNTTATINTNSTSATLKINGAGSVVYIKYIKITRKSTGNITIENDDCVVGPNITFGAVSLSKTVTPAEAESGGSFATLRVDGVNLYDGTCDCDNWVAYLFDNATGVSGTYGTDWEFSVEATSSSEYWTCIDYGTSAFSNETLTIYYSFLSEPEPGEYTADLIARTWDDEVNNYDFNIKITLTVVAACTESPTVSAGSSSSVLSTTATVSCSSGISSFGSAECSITSYGFVYGTSSIPTTSNTVEQVGTSYELTDVSFSANLTGLSPNTTYYVRPYATNGNGTSYGTQTSFTTLQRYAVTYKINDGSATADEVEYKDYGVDYTVSSDKFSRSGYTLVGWNTSNDGSGTGYDKGATYSTDAALTLYAVWGGTVSFDANGGTESMDAQVVVNGGTCELPECGFTAPSGKFFKCWTEGSTSGTERDAAYSHTVDGDITFYAKWRDPNYTDFVFSCSELTLTAKTVTDGTPIFITSAASKTVRSQDSILIVGSGLTPGQALEFPRLNAKFTVKSRVNGALSVKADGTIDTVAYIFYNPGATTEDGLDKMLGLTVKVGGAKPKQVTLEHNIIGRHLPADFVIAAKNTTANKWYALPANMTGTGNPVPVEIAVDDINNPTVAYTAASNIYKLYLSGDKEKVQLGMKNNVNESSKSFALWANNAKSSTDIGKNVGLAENTLGDNYKWLLTQTNMSITNAQDAKYTISNLNNENSLKSWFAAGGGPKWGLYASGVAELRLIPASDIPFTEAYFVEWGQHGGVIEVDAGSTGINATSVIAHLGEATSSAITLAETKTAVKNGATKYNYTVNFGDAIDFAATESNGAMLTLEWKNGDDVKAMSNIIVPKIIAANTTINTTNYSLKSYWNTEVHVLPGDTLFVDANGYSNKDVTIKELNIYPNATVQVLQDTLKVTNLVLRNGWTRVGGKSYEVARLFVKSTAGSLKVTNAYSDWYIDYDQYYPIAVPWEVTTGGMRYMNTNSTVQAGVTMKYYDGASRAANVQNGVGAGANWKTYSRTVEAVTYSYPETLKPGHGYAMTARRPAGKAFSIIRMPLTIPSAAWTTAGEKGTVGEAPSDSHKDTVQVYAYGDGSTPEYAKGWNFIANPYMSVYAGELSYTDAGEVQYANIPDINFREYDQLPIETTKLKPSSGFLIQAPKDGTVTFGTTHRAVAAPAYRTETPAPDVPTQKAYIRLNGEEAEDMMGLIVDEQYTAAYEANADLQKLLGDGTSLRTYLQYDNMDMAFLAVNSVLAQAWIPVTVRIPTGGTYTYSMHYASRVGELEGVYLMDYLTGQMTNLLDNNYTFTIEAGTTDNRFALNAIVGERQLPTDMDVAEMTGGEVDTDRPVKFIYHDQVYILYRNCIYDATGKQVRKMNR